MASASTDSANGPSEVDVWLEVGREGRCFTYLDSLLIGVDLGDLVLVRLRGREMQGVVMARRNFSVEKKSNATLTLESKCSLSPVEGLIQVAAVDKKWLEWLEAVAVRCHISPFRMLKAAFPPGWLGQRKSLKNQSRRFWWISLEEKSIKAKALPKRQFLLHSALVASGGGAWQKDLHSQGFSAALVKNFISNGFARREQREFSKFEREISWSRNFDEELELPRSLTEEQERAIDIYQGIPSGESLLLWGVTGSGKTEVYLQIAEKELSAGRHCLILTPEIGLIPQLVDRCRKRFGGKVFEYHSGCSDRERVFTWRKSLLSKTPLLVVGTRSAIFLPLDPMGLIVLDEEHDSSYKQESPMPCYHARDLALDRANRTGAKVVLGSATPSLFTWKCLKPDGAIALAKLNNRISNQPLPSVQVVDMRKEMAEGHRRLISRPLMEHLVQLPENGEQALILVPRRGYSSFLSCRSCGEVVQCPNCDVALTVHRGKNSEHWLRCHWCDHRESVSSNCDKCGSNAFKPFGAGTQRVIEHLANELKGLRLLRFDRDTTGGRDGHRKLLEKFATGEADVLIGTQMISKGMDLPRVTLAAVLAADGLLHRPDLLAGEQSLQLFMQLAGRAGRGELPGKVLVQTYCPEHPVISHLVDGSYEDFLKQEANLRRNAGLVPYRRACLLRLSGDLASVTATASASLAEILRPFCSSHGWSLIGPAPSLIARVAGRSRWQILLHGPESSPLPLPSGSVIWEGLPKGVVLSVDPDPLEL